MNKYSITDYAPHEHLSLSGYAATMTCFSVMFSGALALVRRRHSRHVALTDIALLGVATHKLSRILAKDFVTAPLRAPFTRREDHEGAGEVHDEPRPGEARQTLGSLLSCPYCLGPWVATSLATALTMRRGETSFVLSVLGAVAVSDFLHQCYSRLNESRKLVQAQRRHAEAALEKGFEHAAS